VSDLPLIRFIMALREPNFAQSALAFVDALFRADHVAMFVLDHELVPHYLDAASRTRARTAQLAGRVYERSMFYRHDPNTQVATAGTGEEDVMIFRQRAREIRDRGYRTQMYGRFRLRERISAVRAVDGRWFVFNLYRDVRAPAFNDDELRQFRDIAPLLVSCTAKHAALSAKRLPHKIHSKPQTYLETLLASIDARLTRRERQVLALALAGQGTDGIAETLCVRQSTVATLRQRAYGKLGINKVNGLFALCIAKIADE
jgi:DNA-binding CsgD family transcriptional regulator